MTEYRYFKHWLQDFLNDYDVNRLLNEIKKIYPDNLINSDGIENCTIYQNGNIAVITKHVIRDNIEVTKQLTCERIERSINGTLFKNVVLFPTTVLEPGILIN
jgi:hypothetical protein